MKAVPAAIPLRGPILFPGAMRSLSVGRPTSVEAVQAHLTDGQPLVLVPQVDPDEEDALDARLSSVGVVSQVLRAARLPDGSLRVLFEGVERVRIAGSLSVEEGRTVVPIEPMPPSEDDPIAVGALAREVAQLHEQWMAGTGVAPDEHEVLAQAPDDPVRLGDQVAVQLELSLDDRIALLEEPSLHARLEALIGHLAVSLARQKVHGEVNSRVQAAMDKSQREYHLKEQLKAIRAELGQAMGAEGDAELFEERIKDAGMPPEAEAEALREVDRLRSIASDSAEYTIARTWLETVCDFPWSETTEDTTDLKWAKGVLDEDHYGLEDIKERLIEYLAVRQLKPDSKGAILCFVGPPGVGKTSLGRSIAHALGRNFARLALGGVKDETEIRGHRRTYIGALPGRVVRAMIRAGSRNPVIVLDELDKVGTDAARGDPASALLEVLDPEQNVDFVDHYLDLGVDLSQVLFIGTANLTDPIPPALLDRLEIIEVPGYIEEEKTKIASRFLLPKLAEQNGLTEEQIAISDAALKDIIRDYTREAGVRELERQLATVHRKVARKVVEGRDKQMRVIPSTVRKFLGPAKYYSELAERVDQPGVVIGLAWTASGGDILFIEATRMPGKPGLKLTGSLGAVMKESVEAAMSWLRTHAAELDIPKDAFEAEFHLHVPAGAIPKDGPSAGVTMVTALASLVTGRCVRQRLAMTGEITLRGKVLPVGGVKEKVLAARRAGVQTVLLPKHNENDLRNVPGALRRDLDVRFVETITDVLEQALEGE